MLETTEATGSQATKGALNLNVILESKCHAFFCGNKFVHVEFHFSLNNFSGKESIYQSSCYIP